MNGSALSKDLIQGGVESVRIGKSQNAIFSPNWKVSESESVRIGNLRRSTSRLEKCAKN